MIPHCCRSSQANSTNPKQSPSPPIAIVSIRNIILVILTHTPFESLIALITHLANFFSISLSSVSLYHRLCHPPSLLSIIIAISACMHLSAYVTVLPFFVHPGFPVIHSTPTLLPPMRPDTPHPFPRHFLPSMALFTFLLRSVLFAPPLFMLIRLSATTSLLSVLLS